MSTGCHFCGGFPLRGVYLLDNAELRRYSPGRILRLRLCWDHYTMLKRSGERGRVYAKTGIRWWLLGDELPIGDPGVPEQR